MKVTEKVYIPTAGDEIHYHMTCPKNEFQESVEYIRIDAFIERACEWLKKNRKNYSSNALGEEYLIDDFKKAMKGE